MSIRWWFIWLLVTIAAVFAVTWATKAYACDSGQFYDPAHQICQGTPPAAPGYQQPPSNNPWPHSHWPGYGGYQ